jgi:hypothetical protein
LECPSRPAEDAGEHTKPINYTPEKLYPIDHADA